MNVFEALISIIAPTECVACGSEAGALCNNCRAGLVPAPPRCFLCSTFLDSGSLCRQCAKRLAFKKLSVASEYSGLGKTLVRQLKFSYERDVAAVLASCISEELLVDNMLDDVTLLVPLPTATSRVRQRGFDHTLRITKHLSNDLAVPYCALLQRTSQSRQLGRSRKDRLAFGESNFFIQKPKLLSGHTVLLVDDVVTTGASLQAAAKTLRQAGAKRVYAAVFAHRR